MKLPEDLDYYGKDYHCLQERHQQIQYEDVVDKQKQVYLARCYDQVLYYKIPIGINSDK